MAELKGKDDSFIQILYIMLVVFHTNKFKHVFISFSEEIIYFVVYRSSWEPIEFITGVIIRSPGSYRIRLIETEAFNILMA